MVDYPQGNFVPDILSLSCFPFQTQHLGVRELIIIYSLLCIQAQTLQYKLLLKNASCFLSSQCWQVVQFLGQN